MSVDDSRHNAAIQAANVIDKVDDATLKQHQRCVDELAKFGLMLGRAGLYPHVVLGQMNQVAAYAFVEHIMPNYQGVPASDDTTRKEQQ